MSKILHCIFILSFMLLAITFESVGSEKDNDNEFLTYRQIESPVMCIDQIIEDEIIINDTTFRRFEGTLYYDIDGKRVNSSQFKVKTCVKMKTDKNNRLLSLYEAVDEGNNDNPDAVSPVIVENMRREVYQVKGEKDTSEVKKKEVMRKEGNVWKN